MRPAISSTGHGTARDAAGNRDSRAPGVVKLGDLSRLVDQRVGHRGANDAHRRRTVLARGTGGRTRAAVPRPYASPPKTPMILI